LGGVVAVAGIRKAAFILSGIAAIGLLIAFAFIVAANYGVDVPLPKFKP
jgi:hypothetical protein